MIRILLCCLLFWSSPSFAESKLTHRMQMTIKRLQHVSGCGIIITSGHRTTKDNIRVGGSPKSQHLIGNAIDFIFKCQTLVRTVAIAKVYCIGVGVYPRHVHCDMRKGKKVMWYGTYK